MAGSARSVRRWWEKSLRDLFAAPPCRRPFVADCFQFKTYSPQKLHIAQRRRQLRQMEGRQPAGEQRPVEIADPVVVVEVDVAQQRPSSAGDGGWIFVADETMAHVQQQPNVGVSRPPQPRQHRCCVGQGSSGDGLDAEVDHPAGGVIRQQAARLGEAGQACRAAVHAGDDVSVRGAQAAGVGELPARSLQSLAAPSGVGCIQGAAVRQPAADGGAAHQHAGVGQRVAIRRRPVFQGHDIDGGEAKVSCQAHLRGEVGRRTVQQHAQRPGIYRIVHG